MRFTVMHLNAYETHREDDANLVLHTFSSVDFTFAKDRHQREMAIHKLHTLKETLDVYSDFLQALDGAALDAESAALQAEMLGVFAHDTTNMRASMASAFIAALYSSQKQRDYELESLFTKTARL